MSWTEIKHSLNDTLGTENFKPLNKQIFNWSIPVNSRFEYSTVSLPSGINTVTANFSSGYKKVLGIYMWVSNSSYVSIKAGLITIELDGVEYGLSLQTTSSSGGYLCIPNLINYNNMVTSYFKVELSSADENNKRFITFDYKNSCSISVNVKNNETSNSNSNNLRIGLLYTE